MTMVKHILFAVLLIVSANTHAQSGDSAGVVHVLKGRATATTADGNIRSISKGSKVFAAEIVSTAAASYTRLQLKDKSWILLRPDTRFLLEDVQYSEESQEGIGFFALLKGGFRAVTGLIRDKLKYRFNTRVATIGIRGTKFMVRVCNRDCADIDPVPADGLYLEVIEQTVVLENHAGQFTYHEGQFIYIADDRSEPQLLDGRPGIFGQSPIPAADPADCIQ